MGYFITNLQRTTQGISTVIVLFLITLLFACQKEAVNVQEIEEDATLDVVSFQDGEIIPGQYIVILKEEYASSKFRFGKDISHEERREIVLSDAQNLLRENAVVANEFEQVFTSSVAGFALKLDENQRNALSKDERIAYIEPDRYVVLNNPGRGNGGGGGSTSPSQTIPWGITHVGGHGDGTGLVAWVLDTGIEYEHEDLLVDQTRGFTVFTNGPDSRDANDLNGHGTHVAGTIGAIDNSIGVVGVAAGATLVPVKVLDRRGSGTYSGVIAGVDYVAANANAGDVANMSLGGGYSATLNNAVINAANNAGVYFALAAGNDGKDASTVSPASSSTGSSRIYTICAVGSSNNFASWSNYNSTIVSFCSPGVAIHSTWIENGYNTISGTSMAAPHVAGILLLNNGTINSNGTSYSSKDGHYYPVSHR